MSGLAAPSPSSGPAAARQAVLPPAIVAVKLAEALSNGDVIYIAADEQRAETVAGLLTGAAPGVCVLHAPSSDSLPGDRSPPSPANAGRRVAAFRRLRALSEERSRPPIAFVTTAEASARLYPAPEAFDAAPPVLRTGDHIDATAFEADLLELGYIRDDRVDEPGEVAVRGQVIDIFPADAGQPVRLELDETRILAIRRYDPVTQRGEELLERIEVGRASEPSDPAVASLLDHLAGAAIALDSDVDRRRARYAALVRDVPSLPDHRIEALCDHAQWAALLKQRPRIELAADADGIPRFVEDAAPLRQMGRLVRPHLDAGGRLLLAGAERDLRFLDRRVTRTLGRPLRRMGSWSELGQLQPGAAATIVLPIAQGWHAHDLIVVAAADLLGGRAETGLSSPVAASPLADLGELRRGDVVVHEDHGIGVVAGIEPLPAVGPQDAGDAIRLTYAANASRLIPATDADLIWRYGGDMGAVTLDRLDGSSWSKRRGDIDRAIAESAMALTMLAAERAKRRIPTIQTDMPAYERFSAAFPFSETADQARAIAAIRDDLAGDRPMDRLVIGDVGYGKTEVALRAAALAVFGGRQVAIAAPTTVLVRQHLETFARRFADSGIRIAGLSRLSTAAEKRAVRQGLAEGSIDIVIGTGAVATKGVEYGRLGLVVIDEEQRFGAADKRKLRALGESHILTLSATPIPRTLQMALVGLQQLSVIATPPARRQPIRTTVTTFDPTLVRTALMRERSRGGQSFVVVPRIEDMSELATQLAKLVPELRVVEAHGRMPAGEMDAAMVGFASGDGDILLATNIIEAGLDVPRANSMIVWRADRFGLAQLHQLRGRVGRGSRRGQVLLTTAPGATISEATSQRLRTLQAFDRLGAGFAISARDLDLRGAGDLAGDDQAGHMKLIGVDLYQHLLGMALRQARGEKVDRWTPDLELGVSGRLPQSWIPDEDLRIALYARLARIADTEALEAFEEELEDRFGELPSDARTLLLVSRIRLMARDTAVARIVAGPAALALEPRHGNGTDLEKLGLIELRGRYLLKESIADPMARLERLGRLLEALDIERR
jgi:transcription-repair coupling factor (superfamily II helicase)